MAGRPGAKFDPTFFERWSPEMAWALGLLFTDGHLRPAVGHTAIRLHFTQKTPELLEKLKALMQSDTTVYSSPRRVYNGKVAGAVYHFAISNARLGNRMLELGLTPRKSLTMRFPPVPPEYV
ncbi:MAG TPA: hypothetical protein VGT02_08450, partial [Methylomirabilota bacterium]|nr:hypothetical protein [Methylomirabilota bacterium]